MPEQATGSVIERDGKAVGSRLLGQPFTSPQYFWGRPSATGPLPYNGAASSGSNQGPTNPALHDAVKDRIAALRAADPGNTSAGPVDLVTASGSGLDPAHLAGGRRVSGGRVVARRAVVTEAEVRQLVASTTEGRTFGFLGEPRVNVLELNLALDAHAKQAMLP